MSSRWRPGLAVVVALVVSLWASVAAAHGRDTSYSSWTLTPAERGIEIAVEVRVSARDLGRLGGPEAVARALALPGCEPSEASLGVREAAGGEALVSWGVVCSEPPARVELGLVGALGPAHLHVARVRDLAGAWGPRQVLTIGAAELELGAVAADELGRGRQLAGFVGLGLTHILEGWDHLAFLLALLLGAMSLGRVTALVTGFTLGHSLTLGLAALGLARPEPALIELLIAASIVVVAARSLQGERAGEGEGEGESEGWEAEQVGGALGLTALVAAFGGRASALVAAGAGLFAWAYLRRPAVERRSKPAAWSWAPVLLIAGFGLVHGAGFAGVLREVGLPPEARVGSLLAFNLGVELGQLCFVALAWPLVTYLRRRWPAVQRWTALGLASLGMAAVVVRALS